MTDELTQCLNTSGTPSPREKVLQLAEGLVDMKLSGSHLCIPRSTSAMLLGHWQPTASLFTMKVGRMQTSRTILARLFTWTQGCGDGDRRKRTWSLEVGTLSAKADGMFRWVFCQLGILRHRFPLSVLNILEELPESLDKTYEQLLREINQANIKERAEVLAVDFNADWRWEDNEEAVLSTCSSLVTVDMDGHSRVARFFHSSMKSLHGEVGELNLRILGFKSPRKFSRRGSIFAPNGRVDCDSIVGFPVAQYAVEHRSDHVKFENVLSHMKLKDGVDGLFKTSRISGHRVWLLREYPGLQGPSTSSSGIAPRRDRQTGRSTTHAAYNGHLEVAEILLEHNAEVNACEVDDQVPLHYAAEWASGPCAIIIESRTLKAVSYGNDSPDAQVEERDESNTIVERAI
ncbi:hypothetical protein EDB86DRAFT_3240443 [Lactarius hatsudake]|nr:hypothetical protein EDB86DRAFT_3240443 [Lactarius hatsudake]